MSQALREKAPPVGGADSSAPVRRSAKRRTGATGLVLSSLYILLLLVFGVGPTVYALYLSMTNGLGQFTGLGQYVRAAQDFRFVDAFANIGVYLGIWLVTLLVLVVTLALVLHSLGRYASSTLRFLFYLPGALAGVASVLVWLFMLDPTASPFSTVLHFLGQSTLSDTILPSHLPVVFMVIAFWTGAGGWIIVMYGALNNIPLEVLDAAKVDGASGLQTAWQIQIPMIRKWIYYMLILGFATGTQLFVEPQLVYAASGGGVSPTWSPNELAYTYAFQNDNFNVAAAISVYLLILSLIVALILVFRSGLFDVEEEES